MIMKRKARPIRCVLAKRLRASSDQQRATEDAIDALIRAMVAAEIDRNRKGMVQITAKPTAHTDPTSPA